MSDFSGSSLVSFIACLAVKWTCRCFCVFEQAQQFAWHFPLTRHIVPHFLFEVPHPVAVQFQPHHPLSATAIAMPTSPTVSLRQPGPLQSFSIGTLQPLGASTSSSTAMVPIVGVAPPPLMYTPAVAATAGVALPMAAHATSTPLLQSTYETESRAANERVRQ